jgi:uncharacterized RDD family membrane protein YckC
MTTGKRDRSLGTGVYFADDDYIGIRRRAVILVVDVTVLLLSYAALWTAFDLVGSDLEIEFFVTFWFLAWCYMVVLKATGVGTIGYWLTGVKILNLKGTRPSLLRVTFRDLIWAFGPFNFVMDLLWSGVDDDRQTLRDRFAGTCLVRKYAVPIGTARIHLTYYDAFGFTLMYPRVARPRHAKPADSERS